MSGFFVSLLLSFAVQAVKYGITAVYEARKFRRPNIRDKEGTRVWLENLLRWSAYLQRLFLPDLKTPAFTIAILLELVRPGEKWDMFYTAILHDFNITGTLAPARPVVRSEDSDQGRSGLIRRLCLTLRGPARMYDNGYGMYDQPPSDREIELAEEYLSLARRLLDHPTVLADSHRVWQKVRQ